MFIRPTFRPSQLSLAILATLVLTTHAQALEITDGKAKQLQNSLVQPQDDEPTSDDLEHSLQNNTADILTNPIPGAFVDEKEDEPNQSKSSDSSTDKGNSKTATNDSTTDTKPICSPDALEVGIEHFSYDEVIAEHLVWSGYGDKQHENKLIHKDAKEPLQTLVKAAAKDKVALYPSSIFRSVRAQDAIVKRKIRQKQPAKTIYHTSSPAGYSEHHTGYAVDFAPIDDKFAKTKGYQWLLDNAHKYGWEQTFTKDYAEKSGVSEESWHWRYVGDEHGQALFAARACQPYERPAEPTPDDKADKSDKVNAAPSKDDANANKTDKKSDKQTTAKPKQTKPAKPVKQTPTKKPAANKGK
ncbi:MAG: M15 family metallopeptidase [Moraxella sp.]|nr:M15 family metallopeptidase [Moraxella sp.]